MDIERFIFNKAKVKLEAYKGDLSKYLSENEMKEAKKWGYLPARFNVHHIIPLCCKNATFDMKNLVITDIRLHDWLHTYIYTPVIAKMDEGDKVHIVLPEWKPVMTINDLDPKLRMFYEQKARGQVKLDCFHILKNNDRQR